MYDLTFLTGCFAIQEVLYAGVDGAICKARVQARRPGSVQRMHMGLQFNVRGSGDELVNEVKRLGYLRDRECPLEVRVGDTLVIYLSKSAS
jgi:hypothetical protein